MSFVVRACLRATALLAVLGAGLGLAMGWPELRDHLPGYAMALPFAWVPMLLFGLIYHVMPGLGEGPLPVVQCGTAATGLVLTTGSLALALFGQGGAEPGILVGATLTALSMVLFAAIVLRGTRVPTARCGLPAIA